MELKSIRLHVLDPFCIPPPGGWVSRNGRRTNACAWPQHSSIGPATMIAMFVAEVIREQAAAFAPYCRLGDVHFRCWLFAEFWEVACPPCPWNRLSIAYPPCQPHFPHTPKTLFFRHKFLSLSSDFFLHHGIQPCFFEFGDLVNMNAQTMPYCQCRGDWTLEWRSRFSFLLLMPQYPWQLVYGPTVSTTLFLFFFGVSRGRGGYVRVCWGFTVGMSKI